MPPAGAGAKHVVMLAEGQTREGLMLHRDQRTYWGINYPSNEEAKRARDEQARVWRQAGYHVSCSRIPNQLRPYAGLGQPDGRSGHVYVVRKVEL
mgnify:FL=1